MVRDTTHTGSVNLSAEPPPLWRLRNERKKIKKRKKKGSTSVWGAKEKKMAEKANVAVEQEKVVREAPRFIIGQGSITGVDLKTYKNQKGQEYQVVIPEVAVVVDERGLVKRYKGKWSIDFAKRILKHLKSIGLLHPDSVRFSDLVGRPTKTKVAERMFYGENKEAVYYKYADFITFLDNEGNAIYIPKDEEVVIK